MCPFKGVGVPGLWFPTILSVPKDVHLATIPLNRQLQCDVLQIGIGE